MKGHAEDRGGGFWFPGRWLGGLSLILSPLLLLSGVLLRAEFHFFYPDQLAAFEDHPTLMVTSYSAFVMGNVLMWPAIIALAREIGATRPTWALWGGSLVMLGLFTRTFHGGIDHMAFQLVEVQSLGMATEAVGDSYRAFHVVRYLYGDVLIGWVVISIGAYLSGVLGPVRSVALALMAIIPLGALKGTHWTSIVGVVGLCLALAPLGVAMLRNGPPLSRRAITWTVVFVLASVVLIYLTIRFPVLVDN